MYINKVNGYQYTHSKMRAPLHVARLVAASILGRQLFTTEHIHHADNNKTNNNPENIVICSSQKDHNELHMLINSKKESGHAGWRKCKFCKQYDDPANMSFIKQSYSGGYRHKSCAAKYVLERRHRLNISKKYRRELCLS